MHHCCQAEAPCLPVTAACSSTTQVLGLPAPERFPALLPVSSFTEPGQSLVMATTSGGIKQTSLEAFGRLKKTGLAAIKLLEVSASTPS